MEAWMTCCLPAVLVVALPLLLFARLVLKGELYVLLQSTCAVLRLLFKHHCYMLAADFLHFRVSVLVLYFHSPTHTHTHTLYVDLNIVPLEGSVPLEPAGF